MPPKSSRRTSSGPRAVSKKAAGQSTLTFNSKVTKPSAAQKPGKKSLEAFDKVLEVPSKKEVPHEQDEVEPEPVEIEDVASEPAQKEIVKALSPEEEQASKISQYAIKKYWAAKERERKAPRVHQEDLTVHEKVLREFDTTGSYGSSIGIPRTQRCKRAHALGLNPPIEVLAVLLKEQEDKDVKSQRSIVDELMGNQYVVEP